LHELEEVGLDMPTKLKPQCHNNNRHQHLNHKHQLKQEVHLVVEAVLLVEVEVEVERVVLHNLLEEEQIPLSNSRLQQNKHPLMGC
jgi:hypothetical protein